MIRKRDIRFVRRQAIIRGVLRQPEVELEEVIEALREEVAELRFQLRDSKPGERDTLTAAPR